MDEVGVKIHDKLRWFLQALLISAVTLAPALGQIHKTIHGQASLHVVENDVLCYHDEGSLVCLALDHLASGDGLQSACTTLVVAQTQPFYSSVQCKPCFTQLLLAFSARAPPVFL